MEKPKGDATAFGTVRMSANVLQDGGTRPGGTRGQNIPSAPAGAPLAVGEASKPGGSHGQSISVAGGEPIAVGETRPGGSTGQGA